MAMHELTTADEQCLDRLAPDVFDNAIDPVQLARFLGDPRHLMLVAIEDDLAEARAIGARPGGTRE